MTAASDWAGAVGRVWAEEWRRTERAFAAIGATLDAAIDRVAPVAGRAIDIGCGVGSTTLALARVRPGLSVTGVDLAAPLVAVARQRAADGALSDPPSAAYRPKPGSGGGDTQENYALDSRPGGIPANVVASSHARRHAAPVPGAIVPQDQRAMPVRADGPRTTSRMTDGAWPTSRLFGNEDARAPDPAPGRIVPTFTVADATVAAARLAPLDLFVSRHGVMFFPDPVAAFATLHAAAAPGAPLVFSCFRARADNDWSHAIDMVLGTPPAAPGYAPGPYGLADPGFTAATLAAAGWRDAQAVAHAVPFVVGAGEDPVADALGFYRRIGSAAAILAAATPAACSAIEARLGAMLRERIAGGAIAFTAAFWIWTATAGKARA